MHTATCSPTENNIDMHRDISRPCIVNRATITLYPIGRSVRATITLYETC